MLLVNIKKKLGNFKLDMEFTANNEVLSLLGASGCGKSMTLRCIAGVETPDEGQIILKDRILYDSSKGINLPPQERKVGLLFQNYALFPNMTVEKNIAIGIRNKEKKERTVNEMIEAFSLKGSEKKYPAQLSGGQQQRVALARMLVNKPELIMLDEPFSALDTYLRWQMEQELIPILKKHEGTKLYVSHNRDEVFRISDRIAVLKEGKIEEINDRKALFNKPKSVNTTIMTGCKNISRAEKINDYKIRAIDWDLELSCSEKVQDNISHVGIRAHHIKLCYERNGDNIFIMKPVGLIEDLFSKILIFSKNKDNPCSNIYMDISLEDYKTIENDITITGCHSDQPGGISINFNKENLILLYDK